MLTSFLRRASACLLLEDCSYYFSFIFAAQNCVKSLKNVLFACSNIISQVGISNPKASRSREHIPLPTLSSDSISYVVSLPLNVADITRSWANFSDAGMTTRMVRRGFTLQNKVCVLLCICGATIRPVLICSFLFFSPAASLTPSTYICLLLCFTREQGRRRR